MNKGLHNNTMFMVIMCFIICAYYVVNYIRKPVAILLCTVNTSERRNMYRDVIRWWIKYRKACGQFYLHFDLFIVDSTTNSFDQDIESVCKICRFDQQKQQSFQTDPSNSTWMEMRALEHAMVCFGSEFENKYSHFVKLTGKYKLPDFYYVLVQIRIFYGDIFVQNRHDRYSQNSELYVLKTSIVKSFVHTISRMIKDMKGRTFIMEQCLYTYMLRSNYIINRLYLQRNSAHYKRSDGKIMRSL